MGLTIGTKKLPLLPVTALIEGWPYLGEGVGDNRLKTNYIKTPEKHSFYSCSPLFVQTGFSLRFCQQILIWPKTKRRKKADLPTYPNVLGMLQETNIFVFRPNRGERNRDILLQFSTIYRYFNDLSSSILNSNTQIHRVTRINKTKVSDISPCPALIPSRLHTQSDRLRMPINHGRKIKSIDTSSKTH